MNSDQDRWTRATQAFEVDFASMEVEEEVDLISIAFYALPFAAAVVAIALLVWEWLL